ncbi:MAG: integrase [Alcaligenaceae bacterium]|nr:integrase [Alcaligenaceae bacterium SAGV5]MPS55183.1 integrase [Alcaligenaceae bacterium SAGV3]MPT57874.1 integrase [Alcaligenaceae bacterium]
MNSPGSDFPVGSPAYHRIDRILHELRAISANSDTAGRARIEAVERELSSMLTSAAPTFTPLVDWLEVYRRIIRERGLSLSTLQNREAILRRLETTMGRAFTGAIRPYDLAQFVRGYVERDNLHAARHARTTLIDIFSEAVSDGVIDHNPALSLRRIAAPVRRSRLTLDLWRAAYEHAAQYAPWMQRAMELALVAVQRRSDIAAIQFDHVRGEFLHIEQKKTGVRLRLHLGIRLDVLGLTIGDVLERCAAGTDGAHLIRHNDTRGKVKAGAPVHPQTLSNRFGEIMRKISPSPAGVAPSFHEQRSLGARLYQAQGRQPQSLLGHKRSATTEMYLDSRGTEWVEVR